MTARDCAEISIKSIIFSGELGPGERLPPERLLSQHLGVSRVPLREALKSLESAGFIRTTVGAKGGSRVSDASTLARCWEEWLRVYAPRLRSACEFRRTVEMKIAWLAAARRTIDDLQSLEAIAESMDRSPTWVSLWHSHFHNSLMVAAHNEYFERAAVALRAELFAPIEGYGIRIDVQTLRNLHGDILAAVIEQDPPGASDAMQTHLAFTERLFFRRAEDLGLNARG
jgi:GntR family transcriptional regulator, transcriptional repressor for pyruvate dehydrogenase complex